LKIMEERLSAKYSYNSLRQIIQDRVRLGGIFWDIDQLKKSLSGITSIEQDESAIAPPSVSEMFHYISQQINLDHEILMYLTPKVIHNCTVSPHIDGPFALEEILKMIHRAKHFINISIMLFFNDPAGKSIVEALIEAAGRGVKIRVMVDKATTEADFFFSLQSHVVTLRGEFGHIAKPMEAAGIHVHRTDPEVYDKHCWTNKYRPKRVQEGVPELFLKIQDLVQGSHHFEGINSVYHRKIMIVDNRESFLGSVNFGEEYLFKDPLIPTSTNPRGIPPVPYWHDGLFHVQGTQFAKHLNRVFAQQWFVLGGELFDIAEFAENPDEGEDTCAVFFSFPGNPVNVSQSFFQAAVAHCAGDIIIENPYILNKDFWAALHSIPHEQATKIRILTCVEKTDHKFVPPNFRINAEQPCKNGVRFYDYSHCGVFAHWKIFVDLETQTVFHGSTNLNTRSALHDFEIDVLVKSPRVFNAIKDQLELDLNGAKLTELTEVDANVFDRLINSMAVYFS